MKKEQISQSLLLYEHFTSIFSLHYKLLILEVIIDCGSAFVTNGNEIEWKGVQFPGRDASDKISRGGQSADARDASKICAFVLQEHQD